MQENETMGDTSQAQDKPEPSTMQTTQQTGPVPNSNKIPPTPSEPSTGSPKKNKTLYSILAVILIVLIALAAISLNNAPQPKTTNANKTTTNTTTTNITVQTTIPTQAPQPPPKPQNSYTLLSGIPLAPSMSDYYTYTSNITAVDQYGLPFTKNLISSKTLPSNYTLKIPRAYANVTSPIMVFISTTIYPNQIQAQSDYKFLLKNITNISIARVVGPVNNSEIYYAKSFNLTLIGAALTSGNTVSVMLTWGNPATFINSSYVSAMVLKEYSIINGKN